MPPGETDVVIDAENTIEPDSRATPPLSTTTSTSTSTATPDADTDDGYDTESVSGDSTSLASNVRDYIFENNRRYHKYKEGRYLIPNDDPEQEREDMKHAMIVHLCGGKLHFAPLEDPQEILDIGTGTGIWAIDSTFKRYQCFFFKSLVLTRYLQWLMNTLVPRLLVLISVQSNLCGHRPMRSFMSTMPRRTGLMGKRRWIMCMRGI